MCLGVVSGAVCLFFELLYLLIVPGVFVVISFCLFAGSSQTGDKMGILVAGINGEILASNCVAGLPDTYTAFRNLTVSYGGKSSEVDILVVGPTGVFVIEVKNLNGTIYGDAEESQWEQYKVGRAGTPYTKNFYNPIKQVNTHVYRVAHYLREKGIDVYVNAIVYFAASETLVVTSGTDGRTQVFCAKEDGENEMRRYILGSSRHLSQKQTEAIIKTLNAL